MNCFFPAAPRPIQSPWRCLLQQRAAHLTGSFEGVNRPAATADAPAVARLRAAGASEVIPEALEAALQLGDHVLARLDVSPARRGELIDAERRSAD